MTVRVVVDTNVLVSYLLRSSGSSHAVRSILDLAFDQRIRLVIPEIVLAELRSVVAKKPYLADHIGSETVESFMAVLRASAEIVPDFGGPVPTVTRDPDDDFVLAAAIYAGADVLVSGDRDLLDLGELVAPLRIVTPLQFIDGFESIVAAP